MVKKKKVMLDDGFTGSLAVGTLKIVWPSPPEKHSDEQGIQWGGNGRRQTSD
jgi:hypothetical protein